MGSDSLTGIDAPQGRFGTASVVRRAERARRRRVLTRVTGGGIAVAAVCSAVLATASVRGAPAPTPAAQTAVPAAAVLTVTCTPRGIEVDRTEVAASRDGVHLRVVDTSGRPHMMFGYRSLPGGTEIGWPGSGGGGEELTAAERVLVVSTPPGQLVVECTERGRSGSRRVVSVADPQGWFRPGSPSEAGCLVRGIGDWEQVPGRGTTAHEAAENMLRNLAGDDAAARQVSMAHVGYVGGARQPFLLHQEGKPSLIGVATRSGGTWSATREYICGPATDADRTPWPDVPRVDACSARNGGWCSSST